MIIFDLDGTLADCEHRRHFVDPSNDLNYRMCLEDASGKHKRGKWYHDNANEFKPNWKAFYEACDKDVVIEPVMRTFTKYWIGEKPEEVQIWSGRCESVREKTVNWFLDNWFIGLYKHEIECLNRILKMRPIGDSTPDDELKEKWLDEYIRFPNVDMANSPSINKIDFVFDDRPKVIRMWRRRGFFVFNCCQHDQEF